MAVKIIGAGLGRTGTMSLKIALEQLGFVKCYHMAEVLMNPRHAAYWVEAADGRPDWERISRGMRRASTIPAAGIGAS